MGILLILAALDVRLGQGYFAYRYSPIRSQRTFHILPMLLIGLVACGAIRQLASVHRRARQVGVLLLVLCAIGTGLWNWWAPPKPFTQQMFNMTSFSSDGAFVFEASQFSSLPAYLRDFPKRLETSVEKMGGTRVLSNPPGMTIVSRWMLDATHRPDTAAAPDAFERYLISQQEIEPADAHPIANALRVSFVLTALYVLAAMSGYPLGRLFLPPAGAAVFAIVLAFNPCTVLFVPGKDPAQLLFVNAMLWAFFAAWKRRSIWPAFAAGVVLILGAVMSLVQIWMALITVAAVTWHDRRRIAAVARDCVGPLALGAVITCLVVYLATGWSIPLTLWAVSRRWSSLQGTFAMNRSTWYVIGLPIFLLFVSPGLWTFAGMKLRRPRLTFGARLAICSIAVMLFIYFVVGLTYELPRLWVAFLSPLTLGLAIDWPILKGRGEHPRATKVLMAIVLTQVVFTALHWTIFDVRETEYRLTTGRFYR